MGKRKSRKIQQKAAAPKCDTVFDCPYCSHRQTIEVQIMKKDGIGKLYCRICGYKYQRRLGPLDKQVDIYCAMIDEAADLNNKKQNTGIGFQNRDGDNNSDELGEAENGEDLLDVVASQKKRAQLDSDEEEAKDSKNPELVDALIRKSSGLSASHKIAEMGLDRAKSQEAEPVHKSFKQENQKDFGAIMSESAAA